MDELTKDQAFAFQIIAASGDARSMAYGALEAAKAGNFAEAEELMAKAEEASAEAHRVQADLLAAEANGEDIKTSIILVHSQDHFMTSMLAIELIKEIITMYKKIGG